MAEAVVRVYNDMHAAESARRQLLESGFDPAEVELTATTDESGPAVGNFVLDEKDTGQGPAPGPISKFFGLEERTGAYNNDNPQWPGTFKLVVATPDGEHERRANEILDRIGGGVDVDGRRH